MRYCDWSRRPAARFLGRGMAAASRQAGFFRAARLNLGRKTYRQLIGDPALYNREDSFQFEFHVFDKRNMGASGTGERCSNMVTVRSVWWTARSMALSSCPKMEFHSFTEVTTTASWCLIREDGR